MAATAGKKPAVVVMVFAVAGIILCFMLREVVRGWPLISAYSWDLCVPLLILSLTLGVISALLGAKAAQLLVEGLGARISFRRLLLILCTTQTSRYLPGRIWGVLGLVVMLEREGVQRATAASLPFLHQGLMTLALMVVGCWLFVFHGSEETTQTVARLLPWMGFLGFAAMGLLPLLVKVAGMAAGDRLGGLRSLAAAWGRYYLASVLVLLTAVMLAVAFVVFVAGLARISWLDAPRIGGAFLLSYVAGWLAFFLPGGIGVREGALAYLLGSGFGIPVGSALALAARAWATLMEILLLAMVWLWVGVVKREAFLRTRPPRKDEG